jgi:hypothetical protein
MDTQSVVAFTATATLASVALSPSPNAVGLVGLLVILQLYPKFFSRGTTPFLSPWGASTIGATLSHARAASNALQASVLSIILLALLSAVVSAIPVAAIYFDARFMGKNHRYNWSRLAAFPALWASTWGILSVLTPVGRLLTWSPVIGLGPYTWISAYLGPWGVDFVVAAWSVALTEAVAVPLSQRALSIEDPEDPRNVAHVTPYTDDPEAPVARDSSPLFHKSAFTLSLLILVIPSFWTPVIPIPTHTTTTTPFSLGCVLPKTHLPNRTPHPPTLDDYISETKKMSSSAKLVLWPEGTLKFDTEAERNATFEKIFEDVLKNHKGLHIGVGFEENAPESWSKRTSKRNGFALLVDGEVALQYFKRNLVPSKLAFHPIILGSKLTSGLQL